MEQGKHTGTVAEAIKHRNDGHDDDITVLAVKLTDNE